MKEINMFSTYGFRIGDCVITDDLAVIIDKINEFYRLLPIDCEGMRFCHPNLHNQIQLFKKHFNKDDCKDLICEVPKDITMFFSDADWGLRNFGSGYSDPTRKQRKRGVFAVFKNVEFIQNDTLTFKINKLNYNLVSMGDSKGNLLQSFCRAFND